MKIALAQLDYHVGNFDLNRSKIIGHIQEAKNQRADLVVFAELAICGYPPRDFLEFRHFIELCTESIKEIASYCKGIAAVVGGPSVNPSIKGKDLYNSAFFLMDGKVDSIIHKTLLPTYDVFDEYRYFEPNTSFRCIELNGCKIALTICEDLWNIDDNPMYVLNPMDELIKEKPDFALNIAASPFSYTHDEKRTGILRKNAETYGIPFFYVNHTGAQTELIFDGQSTVVNHKGEIYKMPAFQECMEVFDLDTVRNGIGSKFYVPENKIKLIHCALVEGISDYFNKLNFNRAALGMSGGVDSAIVFALAVKALGKENVLPVLLPSEYSSKGSINDSLEMIKRLGTRHEIIPIKEIFSQYISTLHPVFGNAKPDITEENLQARIRGTLLMAVCNKLGYILLNTSNKSEMAVGYSTLYGDSIGAISVLGDVYKTDIYKLAEYINLTEGNVIPENILTKAPSAELRPGQKDTDSLPPYDVLDRILFEYIENHQGPREIVAMGYEKSLVDRILKMVNQNEFKRFQAPPVLRISEKGFGSGRRLPIVGKYLS